MPYCAFLYGQEQGKFRQGLWSRFWDTVFFLCYPYFYILNYGGYLIDQNFLFGE